VGIAIRVKVLYNPQPTPLGVRNMLWIFSVIFAFLWAMGLVNGYTFAGAIHILLILAITALVFEVVSRGKFGG
jgi:hypothetical protein